MKAGKFIVGCAFVVFMTVSLSSCALIITAVRSTPRNITVDPNIPVEEAAVVKIDYNIAVREYNGIDIEKAWYPKDDLKAINAAIPPGETHLLFDIYKVFNRGNSSFSFTAKDIELKYDFEAGKKYRLGLYTEDIGNFIYPRRKIFLAIWDGDAASGSGESNNAILKSWELSEIPF